MNKRDIFDVLDALPASLAEILVESEISEDEMLHLGFISIGFQFKNRRSPEITTQMVKNFRERLSELKLKQETPVAKVLYNKLKPHIREKMEKSRQKGQSRP